MGMGYGAIYKKWLSSIQPCDIDESEMTKIMNSECKEDVDMRNPIEITDLIFDYGCDHDGVWRPNLKFSPKQPVEQPKQVGSDFIETYDKEWIVDFVVWYSGMNKKSVDRAFQRYIDEVVLNNK